MRPTFLCALLMSYGFVAAADDAPCPDSHRRAGNPQEVSRFAASRYREAFTGGQVGGGCLFRKGECAGEPQGTWGWDYVGLGRRPGRIFLGWCGDRKHQEPAAKYATDGPRVKDVFAPIPQSKAGGHE